MLPSASGFGFLAETEISRLEGTPAAIGLVPRVESNVSASVPECFGASFCACARRSRSASATGFTNSCAAAAFSAVVPRPGSHPTPDLAPQRLSRRFEACGERARNRLREQHLTEAERVSATMCPSLSAAEG